jgi:lambda repressor-like predicted transcriptional regulator
VTILDHPERATTGTRGHDLTRYKHGPDEHGTPGKGCRCAVCNAANLAYRRRRDRLIAYGRWPGLDSGAGTHRRLQALVFNGWSVRQLAARLGRTQPNLRLTLHRSQRVKPDVAAAVRALYDELWDHAPPERDRFERRSVTMARQYALARGWVPPLAWDDDEIDDPAASPANGWERREGVRRWGVLAEDAADLLRAGEEPRQVAERLGVTRSTLATVLTRARQTERTRNAA